MGAVSLMKTLKIGDIRTQIRGGQHGEDQSMPFVPTALGLAGSTLSSFATHAEGSPTSSLDARSWSKITQRFRPAH
jgi:hypothetical protein